MSPRRLPPEPAARRAQDRAGGETGWANTLEVLRAGVCRIVRGLVASAVLPAVVVGCGGDAGPRPSAAAFDVAQRAGHHPRVVDRDLRLLARKSALASAEAASVRRAATELFDLGESLYPQYFPGPAASQSAGPFAYRFYPGSGAFLVVDQTALQVYVLGGPFGDAVTFVGDVIDFVRCVSVSAGYPEADFDSPGGDGDGPGTDGGVGATSADGAIRHADVRLFDGNGLLIGQAVSDAKGTARLKACGARIGPYRIEYRGNDRAQYFDESIARDESALGDWRPFPASESLEVYVPDLTQHVTVSPLTHAAARVFESTGGLATTARPLRAGESATRDGRARALVAADRIRAANQRVQEIINQQFAGTGLTLGDITRPPALAYSSASLQALGNNDRGRYAQLLVALAKAAAAFNPGLQTPAREMSRQLSLDLADGVLDGKDGQGTAVAAAGSRAYEPQALSSAVAVQSVGRLTTEVAGFGSITLDTAGQPCPAGGVGSCFPWASTVTLTAQPGSGATFESWGGACAGASGRTCVLVMSGDKAVSATFGGTLQTLHGLSIGKTGSGSVASSPAGIACGNTCVASFVAGSSVALTATPASGSVFVGWSGACAGTAPTCSVTMDRAKSVVANFSSSTFTVGGVISGLSGQGLRLTNGASTLTLAPGATTFQFPDALPNGSSFAVSVVALPAGQACTVGNSSGVISGASVSNVAVTCTDVSTRYHVGGSISGLSGAGLSLRVDSIDAGLAGTLTLEAPPGTPAFDTSQVPGFAGFGNGASYNLTVATQPNGQTCTVTNGSGVISGGSVSNVTVSCTAASTDFSVRTDIVGLRAWGLSLNFVGGVYSGGPSSYAPNVVGIQWYGFHTGDTYSLTIAAQPTGQTCSVLNGSGTVGSADVTNLLVNCVGTPSFWQVGGSFSPTQFSGTVQLALNGGSPVSFTGSGNSDFYFGDLLCEGCLYDVTVAVQPAGYICTVSNGSGIVSGRAVAGVAVDCVPTGTSQLQSDPGRPGVLSIPSGGRDARPGAVRVRRSGERPPAASSGEASVTPPKRPPAR